jgi:hypothetical protein
MTERLYIVNLMLAHMPPAPLHLWRGEQGGARGKMRFVYDSYSPRRPLAEALRITDDLLQQFLLMLNLQLYPKFLN